MSETIENEEIKNLKREVAKLRLEGNLRKSLSNQLTIQKKIANDAKPEPIPTYDLPSPIATRVEKLNLFPRELTLATLLILITDSSFKSSSEKFIILIYAPFKI